MPQNQKQIKDCPECQRKLGWSEKMLHDGPRVVWQHFTPDGTPDGIEPCRTKRDKVKRCRECFSIITTCIEAKGEGR
jgi:hypothetical protein